MLNLTRREIRNFLRLRCPQGTASYIEVSTVLCQLPPRLSHLLLNAHYCGLDCRCGSAVSSR